MLLFLGSAMILARVLAPSDFGVQAMVLPIAILANNVANLNLQSAVIQHESLDSAAADRLFGLAMRTNLVTAGAMALLAPLLAQLYDEPRVTGVALLWALTIYLTTLSAVQEALLKRQMLFGVVMKAQLAALVLSLIASISAALLGFGYWSLMIQVTVMELTRVVVIWFVCPWRPSRAAAPDSLGTVAGLRRYWRSLSTSRAVAWLGDQLDRIVVGSVGGSYAAGLYDSARRWAGFAFQELYLSLSDVAVGSLSRVRDDRARYRVYMRHVFLPILSLALPVMAFMYIDARRVLHVLLGSQWLDADRFVRMMAIALGCATAGKLMQWQYMSLGQTDRQLRWTFVTTPAGIVAVLLGARGGAYGVAVAVAIANAVLLLPSLWYGSRFSPAPLKDCLTIFLRPLSAALAAALALWAAAPYVPHIGPEAVALAVRLTLFGVLYALVWIALPGGFSAWRDILAGVSELRGWRARGSTPPAPLAQPTS
jgi:PST family polysaccharide transporter